MRLVSSGSGRTVVREAVDDAVVDHLGGAAALGLGPLDGTEHLERRAGVHVLALLEALGEQRIPGQVREHA
jgi:hypothetical protein